MKFIYRSPHLVYTGEKEDGSGIKFLYMAIGLGVQFFHKKILYRHAVMKKFVNKIEDIKEMKIILRDWVKKKKIELKNDRN